MERIGRFILPRLIQHSETISLGQEVLVTHEQMRTKSSTRTVREQRLIVGTPEDITLSRSPTHLVRFESGMYKTGRGLENCVLFRPDNGPTFFIVDSHHLTYPFCAWANFREIFDSPFSYIHIDAHMDSGKLEAFPPKDIKKKRKFLPKHLAFFNGSVWEGNFVSALSQAGLVKEIYFVTIENPLSYAMEGVLSPLTNLYPSEVVTKGHFNYDSPLRADLFQRSPPIVMGIDLDYFGWLSKNFGKSTPLTKAEKLVDQLREVGYSPDLISSIFIAFSPGFEEGYVQPEEKLEIAQYLIQQLEH